MMALAAAEDSSKLVKSWRDALPNANSLGKISLGVGASWLIGRAVSFYMGKKADGINAVPTIKEMVPSKSIVRYLALQACTLFILPFVRSKISETSTNGFAKSFSKPNLDQLFYRWLGLEN